jgi:hypothetical protein
MPACEDGFVVLAGLGAAQGDDGAGDGPVHAGLLDALADDGFASGFDDAGADEQTVGAEPVVAYSGCVGLEVAQGLL